MSRWSLRLLDRAWPIGAIESGCELVPDEPIRCPTCAGFYALVDARGITRGLSARWEALVEARADLEALHGPLDLRDPPAEGLRVVVPWPERTDHGWRGDAECARCRRMVGSASVITSIFGHEEDERVMARARVYDGRDGGGQ